MMCRLCIKCITGTTPDNRFKRASFVLLFLMTMKELEYSLNYEDDEL